MFAEVFDKKSGLMQFHQNSLEIATPWCTCKSPEIPCRTVGVTFYYYAYARSSWHTLIKITRNIEMLLICNEDIKYEIVGGYVVGFYS